MTRFPEAWAWWVSSLMLASQEIPETASPSSPPQVNGPHPYRLQVASCHAQRKTKYPETIFYSLELSKLLTSVNYSNRACAARLKSSVHPQTTQTNELTCCSIWTYAGFMFGSMRGCQSQPWLGRLTSCVQELRSATWTQLSSVLRKTCLEKQN